MTITDFYQKLMDAGLPVIEADDSGSASFSRTLTEEEQLIVSSIINPEGYAEKILELGTEDRIRAIPNWATWTPQEANQWGQDKIGMPLSNARDTLNGLETLNLATFKAAMGILLDILDVMWTMQQAFGQMFIALRDKNWPGLGT